MERGLVVLLEKDHLRLLQVPLLLRETHLRPSQEVDLLLAEEDHQALPRVPPLREADLHPSQEVDLLVEEENLPEIKELAAQNLVVLRNPVVAPNHHQGLLFAKAQNPVARRLVVEAAVANLH